MNRPQDRRRNYDHPHNQMVQRRLARRARRWDQACEAYPASHDASGVPMTRERYEAIQATLPVADRIPW